MEILIKTKNEIEKMNKLELMRFVYKIDASKHFYPKTTKAGRVQAFNIFKEIILRKVS